MKVALLPSYDEGIGNHFRGRKNFSVDPRSNPSRPITEGLPFMFKQSLLAACFSIEIPTLTPVINIQIENVLLCEEIDSEGACAQESLRPNCMPTKNAVKTRASFCSPWTEMNSHL